jgi:photosystem II stability/assembly factor-like uncharacterized protein
MRTFTTLSCLLLLSFQAHGQTDPTSSTVYLATERGLYKSKDSGVTWATVLDTYPADQARGVAAHRTKPDLVFAGGRDGLFRSTDGGNYWRAVIEIQGTVKAVAFNKAALSTVYAVAGQFWRSTDEGDTWTVFASGVPGSPLAIASDPGDENRLYLLTTAGLFRSIDGGDTAVRIARHVHPATIGISVVTGPIGSARVYLAHYGGLEVSPDGGDTWRHLAPRYGTGSGEIQGRPMFEMALLSVRSVAVGEHEPARLVACGVTGIVAWDGYLVVAGPGVYESTSGRDRLFGVHEFNSFRRPGAEPECTVAAFDPGPGGGAWVGTVRGLLRGPAGVFPDWYEVEEFRDIAVYGVAFSGSRSLTQSQQ